MLESRILQTTGFAVRHCSVSARTVESGPGSWTVVDFKTDFEIAGRLDEYREQVALYALAISRATGVGVKGVLLRM